MKRFFRMVSMLAVAGLTFAYTSCTDYSGDIEKNEEAIDTISGKLSTVEQQVSSLNSQVAALQSAQTATDAAVAALKTSLAELQTKHDADIAQLKKDYAAADAALKSEIQSKIDALTKTHETDVKNINAAIDALKKDAAALADRVAAIEKVIPTLATKEYVDATFATKEQMAAALKTIGELQAALETAQKNISALQTKMDKAESDITDLQVAVKAAQAAADKAQNAADAAQADATKALGDIKALKEALGVYAEAGKLEATIEALQAMDSTINADKFNTADFQATFEAALEDVLGAYAEKGALEAKLEALGSKDDELQKQLTALDKKVDDAVKDLNSAVNALDKKVEAYYAEVTTKIDAILGIIENRLTSIAFVPEYYYDGVPAIMFETIAYDPLADNKENEEPECEEADSSDYGNFPNSTYANGYKAFATANTTAKYRLNPRTVGVDCADFSFVGDKAEYIFTRATAPEAPVSIVGVPEYDATTGYAIFTIKKNEKLNNSVDEDKLDIVSLKAVLKTGLTEEEAAAEEKPEVYSEYAYVNEAAVPAAVLAISDKAKLAKNTRDHEYMKTFDAATEENPRYEMPYNKVFDLKTLVATCINAYGEHEALDLDKFGFTYKFSVAKSDYIIPSEGTKTNQQTVIQCVDAEKGLYKVISAEGVEYNKEAIGRTPIVRVDLMHGDNIVTRAFIKLRISVVKEYADINVTGDVKNVTLACPEEKVSMEYTEEEFRAQIYRVLDIAHVDFWNIYQYADAYVEKDGKKVADIDVPQLIDGVESEGEATKKVIWEFTHSQVGKISTKGAKVVGYLTLENKVDAASVYPSKITFKFEVNFNLPTPTVTYKINDIFWKDEVLQANVNVPQDANDVAANCWFNTPIEKQPWIEAPAVKGLPCKEVPAYKIAKVYMNGVAAKTTAGVSLSTLNGEISIALDKSNAAIKTALNSEKGLQAVVEWYVTYNSGDVVVLHTFTVNFIRPVNLNLPVGLSVKDAVDGGDEITFGYDGILTDWRGEAIFAPSEVEVLKEAYFWDKVCSPADHAVVIPAYTKVIKEGYYNVEFEDVTVTIPAGSTVYKASVDLYESANVKAWYEKSGGEYFWSKGNQNFYYLVLDRKTGMATRVYKPAYNWQKVETVVADGRSAAEAEENLRAAVNAKDVHYLDSYTECGRKVGEITTTAVVPSSTSFTFKNVKSIEYVPAQTEEVEAEIVYSECNEMPGPDDYTVYNEGDKVGCWKYTKWVETATEKIDGQYWDFYGPFSNVVLDTKNITTDLETKKLPSGASLVQTSATTALYKNVQSPIQYAYHIYVPAKVTYGWGALNGTLTITVNPVKTIAE